MRGRGWRETEGELEMVSQNVLKQQVEEEGRADDPWCQRQLMDERACESMLGGQTHCQIHKYHT